MTNFPPDPLTSLESSAAEMHELYLGYINAGFSADQALQLVMTILSAGIAAGMNRPE